MIKKGIPFAFATDDDGIWRCEPEEEDSEHKKNVEQEDSEKEALKSVANEFYLAITHENKDQALGDTHSLRRIVINTKDAAFDAIAAATFFPKGVAEN